MPSIRLFAPATAAALLAGFAAHAMSAAAGEAARCPVKGVAFQAGEKTPSVTVNGQKVSFCCGECPQSFAADPEKYVHITARCPVNKAGAAKISKESRLVVNNQLVYFCCLNCPKAYAVNPGKYAKELQDPVTHQAFAPTHESPRATVSGQLYVFSSPETKATFDQDPSRYVQVFH
jgi:YHS domain-containing protein